MLKVVSRNGHYYNYFSECFKFEKVLVGLPETLLQHRPTRNIRER